MTRAKRIRPAENGADQLVCRTSLDDTHKLCTSCGEVTLPMDFAIDRARPGGHRTICKVCRADYDRQRDYRRRAKKYGFEPVVERFTRKQQIERHGDACVYCDLGAFEATDHFLCVAAGGPHTLENVVPSCTSCNSKKYWTFDRLLIEIVRRRQAPGTQAAM